MDVFSLFTKIVISKQKQLQKIDERQFVTHLSLIAQSKIWWPWVKNPASYSKN